MKRVLILFICLCVAFVAIFVSAGCLNNQKLYYSDINNYILASGIVSYINYNEDESTLYIAFEDLSYGFSDNCFKITGANVKIIKDNDVDSYLSVGKTAFFSSAPEYFGDGYIIPIVSLSIDGIEFLSFSEGYKNLLRDY